LRHLRDGHARGADLDRTDVGAVYDVRNPPCSDGAGGQLASGASSSRIPVAASLTCSRT